MLALPSCVECLSLVLLDHPVEYLHWHSVQMIPREAMGFPLESQLRLNQV